MSSDFFSVLIVCLRNTRTRFHVRRERNSQRRLIALNKRHTRAARKIQQQKKKKKKTHTQARARMLDANKLRWNDAKMH